MAVWVGTSDARVTRIAVTAYLAAQTSKLAPVMKKIRKGLLPIALLAVSFAPFTQAHGMPGHVVGGSSVEDRAGADCRAARRNLAG